MASSRPVSLFDPGPALFVEKALPCCSSLFPSTSLPVFPVSLAEGEAEVHRAVAEGVLRGTSSSSTAASPQAVVQSSKRSVSTAVAPKTKPVPWRTLSMCMMWWRYSWHSAFLRVDKWRFWRRQDPFGHLLFHKHGSTRVLGHFFIEGRGFGDLKANAGSAKSWVWTVRDRSQGGDAETVVKFALLFPLALQFKVAFDGARALNRVRLGI